MTVTLLLFYLTLVASILSGLSLAIYLFLPEEAQQALDRLIEVTRSGDSLDEQESGWQQLSEIAARVATWLGAHLGLTRDPALQQRFIRAGLRGTMPADLHQSARILGPLLALLAGSLIPFARYFCMATFAGVAYLLPDLVIAYLIRRRRERIRRSIPDVIDLMVICVDAGLGLDQAMLRVAQELSISHPEANEEILQINREQRAGRARAEAWQAMAERVRIPDVDAMVNMLMQTERFGTPISRALSTFADGIRLKRRQGAEALAAKSTVKIIFPLVFFIFPAIFIVLLGPALLNIYRVMSAQPK